MRRYLKKSSAPPTLMLTSLLDMFTIILIFLIVSFEAENYEFRLNPNVELPESTAKANLKPAVNIAITSAGILVDDNLVYPLDEGGLPEASEDSARIDALVEALEVKYERRFGPRDAARASVAQESDEEYEGFEPIVVVQGDRDLNYRTLYAVLRSAAEAGFFKYRLAILRT